MKSSYLELYYHNDIIDLDLPRYDLTCCSFIVLHEEPKYKFDLYLVTAEKFLHLLLERIWFHHSHYNMVIHHTLFQYTEIKSNCILRLWYQCENPTHFYHKQPCFTLTNTLLIKWCGVSLYAIYALTIL